MIAANSALDEARAISVSGVGASPQSADAAVKPARPSRNSRRRPKMSPSRPPVTSPTANVERVAARDPLQRGQAGAEVGADGRRGDVDDRPVEQVHALDGEDQREDQPAARMALRRRFDRGEAVSLAVSADMVVNGAPNIVRSVTNNVLGHESCSCQVVVSASADLPTPPADARPASTAPVAEPRRDRRRGDGGARRGRRRLAQHARGRRPPRDRPASLYAHFAGKDELLAAMIDRIAGELPIAEVGNGPLAGAAQGRDPRDPLRPGRAPRPRPRRARRTSPPARTRCAGSTACSASCATPACPTR